MRKLKILLFGKYDYARKLIEKRTGKNMQFNTTKLIQSRPGSFLFQCSVRKFGRLIVQLETTANTEPCMH